MVAPMPATCRLDFYQTLLPLPPPPPTQDSFISMSVPLVESIHPSPSSLHRARHTVMLRSPCFVVPGGRSLSSPHVLEKGGALRLLEACLTIHHSLTGCPGFRLLRIYSEAAEKICIFSTGFPTHLPPTPHQGRSQSSGLLA